MSRKKINLIKQICPICNKDFFIKEYRLKFGRGKFCSVECHYKAEKTTKHTEEAKRKMRLLIFSSQKAMRS